MEGVGEKEEKFMTKVLCEINILFDQFFSVQSTKFIGFVKVLWEKHDIHYFLIRTRRGFFTILLRAFDKPKETAPQREK